MSDAMAQGAADTAYVLLAIGALALCSLLARAGFLLFGDYLPLPDALRRALRYAPVAALVGIIVPDVLPWHAGVGPTVDLRLPAALIGVAILVRTRSAVLAIACGMLALWGLRWLFG